MSSSGDRCLVVSRSARPYPFQWRIENFACLLTDTVLTFRGFYPIPGRMWKASFRMDRTRGLFNLYLESPDAIRGVRHQVSLLDAEGGEFYSSDRIVADYVHEDRGYYRCRNVEVYLGSSAWAKLESLPQDTLIIKCVLCFPASVFSTVKQYD